MANKKPPLKTAGKTKTNRLRSSVTFNRQQEMLQVMRNANEMSRAMLSGRLGTQMGGNRDLYQTFGYVLDPGYQDYRNLYDRHGLAARIVDKFAESTWGKAPVILDGKGRSDDIGKQATPFLRDWVSLVDRLSAWQIFKQADVMCGIGKYSIIFLGAPGEDFNKEAGDNGLYYLAAYDEKQAQILSYILDPKSEKFGMPKEYSVDFSSVDTGLTVPGGSTVHYTRTIHIAENRLGSRIYGRPRLQTIINRLYDLEKVTGGGAEAAWLAVYAGLLLLPKEGFEIPEPNSPAIKTISEEMNKLFNQMQRFAMISGVDVHDLGVKEVRIKDIYDTLKTDLAGSVGIPQRIMFGAERGELASTQDQQEWNATIKSRQINFAEPEILRPFINWCIVHGVIAAPEAQNGKFGVEWPPVYTMNEKERADYGLVLAQGANTITNGVPDEAININEWRGEVNLPPLPEDEISQESQGIPAEDKIKFPALPELAEIGANGKEPQG